MPVYFECSVSASYLFNVGCVMFTSQRVILSRIGTTMQVNVEACPYLHYQIRRSKSTRSNTVWPSGGSAQWQIFIGGANRRSIHGGKAAWAGNSIAKEGPFNCAELRSRKGIPLKRQYLYIIIGNRGSQVIFYLAYYQKSRGCCWTEEGVADDFAKALLAIRSSQDVVDAGLQMRAINSSEICEQVNDIGQTTRHYINSSLRA